MWLSIFDVDAQSTLWSLTTGSSSRTIDFNSHWHFEHVVLSILSSLFRHDILSSILCNSLFFADFDLTRMTSIVVSLCSSSQSLFRLISLSFSLIFISICSIISISIDHRSVEFFHDRVNCRQHNFDMNYATSQYAFLCVTFLGIFCSRQFEHFDSKEMQNALFKSSVFTLFTVKEYTLQSLTKMIDV
jgi:hypothetical protein